MRLTRADGYPLMRKIVQGLLPTALASFCHRTSGPCGTPTPYSNSRLIDGDFWKHRNSESSIRRFSVAGICSWIKEQPMRHRYGGCASTTTPCFVALSRLATFGHLDQSEALAAPRGDRRVHNDTNHKSASIVRTLRKAQDRA
jgi:hypothetical protein